MQRFCISLEMNFLQILISVHAIREVWVTRMQVIMYRFQLNKLYYFVTDRRKSYNFNFTDSCFGAWLFQHCVYQCNKDPWWEELCRRGALQQKGRKKKGGRLRETQTKPASLLCYPDVVPQGAQDVAHRCEWRAWLVALPPYVSHSHLSPYHTPSLFIELPQTIPEELTCCSVTGSAFCFEYVWKEGKSLLCAASSQSECLPLACMQGMG